VNHPVAKGAKICTQPFEAIGDGLFASFEEMETNGQLVRGRYNQATFASLRIKA
jgi:hypothetical protein